MNIFKKLFKKKTYIQKTNPENYPDLILVRIPPENGYKTPEQMKRVDDHLCELTLAYFVSPEGKPQQRQDGLWEVCLLDPTEFPIVKKILEKHYGFKVLIEE